MDFRSPDFAALNNRLFFLILPYPSSYLRSDVPLRTISDISSLAQQRTVKNSRLFMYCSIAKTIADCFGEIKE
jgi:hypothetical protein